MAHELPLRITLNSADETAAFAARLAPRLTVGDTVLLEGPIGAGKSVFARAVIQARLAAAGLWEDVPSPTFTLVQTYWDTAAEIWHADLYRLRGPGDCLELGLEDAFDTAICLIEWPDRLGDQAPRDALTVSLHPEADGTGRDVTLAGPDARWAQRLADLTEGQRVD